MGVWEAGWVFGGLVGCLGVWGVGWVLGGLVECLVGWLKVLVVGWVFVRCLVKLRYKVGFVGWGEEFGVWNKTKA